MGMKRLATYSVIPKGRRKLDEYRSDVVYGDTFMVVKTPQFGDPVEYLVCFSKLGEWCDCPGGTHHGHCKHVKMVRDYLKEHHSDPKEVIRGFQ